MVVLHLALVVDRLQRDDGERALGQRIFDLFCVDMDRSLRELGFGDLGVPHRMKAMTEAFYGRARAYRDALAAGDAPALAAAVHRNVLAGEGAGAGLIAEYMIAVARSLAETPTDRLADGQGFAAPSVFAAAPGEASLP
jgi:cytochrome b pre-mRNA-processing protein 3